MWWCYIRALIIPCKKLEGMHSQQPSHYSLRKHLQTFGANSYFSSAMKSCAVRAFALVVEAIIVFVLAIDVLTPSMTAIESVYNSWRPSMTFPLTYDFRVFLFPLLFFLRQRCNWSMLCGSMAPITESAILMRHQTRNTRTI